MYKKSQLLAISERRTVVISLFANLIYVIGVVCFTIPYKFADQGVMGIAVLLKYAFAFNPAYVLLICNALLMVWGARYLPKRFLVWTIINAVTISVVLGLFENIKFPLIHDLFLASVAGGVLKGFGSGLLYRQGVSAGGLDIPITVFRRRYGMEAGQLSFYFNAAILAVSVGIIGFENVMYGFISSYICGVAMDKVLTSFDKRRLVLVVTSNTEAVTEFIAAKLGRGCTLLESQGGYTHNKGQTIMCLLMPRQAMVLKRYLAEHFPSSFMVITDASEVVGKGFKRWRNI